MIVQTLIWIFMIWAIGGVIFIDAAMRIGQDDEEAMARDAAAGRLVFTVRPVGPSGS
jgi:hypothetical protein